MILYLFKSILCSAVFLMVYLLLLEKEKMHRFNRWYLLGSIVCSLLIPLISFTIHPQTLPVLQNVQETYSEIIRFAETTSTSQTLSQKAETNFVPPALWILYALVCLGLLIRFIRNLHALLSQIAKNTVVPYHSAKLVLLKDKVVSHTFLRYIFISESDFTAQTIETEILTHELTHVKEKHSWDILFIELIHSVFWFNPLFIVYKKAIQLNHEFLADDAVVRNSGNIPAYQYLLLEKVSLGNKAYLTSPFNFSVTKKRLVMMTREANPTISFLKKILTVPVLAAMLVLFSTKLILAQVQDNPKTKPATSATTSSTEGASKELLDEYETIIARNMTKTKNGHDILGHVSDAERNRMVTIFKQMNKAQQDEAKVVFMKRYNPLPKETPTEVQLNAWKDSKTYGIWIDEKRVGNEELNKYKAADFSNYFASKLSKNAINYGKHYVQVDLMTNDFYANYLRKETELRNKYPLEMMYRFDKKGLLYIN